jgi:pimeloyl-ACP methyl ester carboxylesterase
MPAVRLFIALALLVAGPATAAPTTSNLEREKNWAEQVVDSVVVGEPVWLSNRGHKFLALYAPPAKGRGSLAVILMHGRGVHPAWGFIDRLRSDLADAGYHTLSLQMPILASEAKFASYGPTFPEAFERLEAGMQYLRQRRNVPRVVLLGHSSGGMSAIAFAAKRPQVPLAGIVAIGLSTLPNGPDIMQPVLMLKTIRVPVLDIYGANDLHEVVSYAAARRTSAEQAGNRNYTAVRTPGADHFFTDHYEILRRQIVDWLARYQGK